MRGISAADLLLVCTVGDTATLSESAEHQRGCVQN